MIVQVTPITTIAEAYAALDAVVPKDQSVFIGLNCQWYGYNSGNERTPMQGSFSIWIEDKKHFYGNTLDVAVAFALASYDPQPTAEQMDAAIAGIELPAEETPAPIAAPVAEPPETDYSNPAEGCFRPGELYMSDPVQPEAIEEPPRQSIAPVEDTREPDNLEMLEDYPETIKTDDDDPAQFPLAPNVPEDDIPF